MLGTDAAGWWQTAATIFAPLVAGGLVAVYHRIHTAEERLRRDVKRARREARLAGRSARAAHRRLDAAGFPDRRTPDPPRQDDEERRLWPGQR